MARAVLVLGSALCMWNDVEAALDLGEFEGVIAAKHSGVIWPGPLKAYVSLHPEKVRDDLHRRKQKGYPEPERIFCHQIVAKVPNVTALEYRFEGQKNTGSSGLFAVKVAHLLGYDRVVLCGIPMEREFGRINGNQPFWNGARHFHAGLVQAVPIIKSYTRSMSGLTMKLLGRPTPEWIRGEV